MTPSSGPGGSASTPVRQTCFDRWAAHYEHGQLQRILYGPVHDKVLEHARHRIPDPGQILDVGCGTGRLTRSCAHHFPSATVIGIDPCAPMLNQAAMFPTPVGWLQARAEALPFGDHVFSLVVSTLSLRHWQNPHQGLAEISRITTRDGIVVIADALIDDVMPPPPSDTSPNRGRHRAMPQLIPRLPGSPRRRQADRVPAGVPYTLAKAGLRTEQVEQIVLALATVTLIIASTG